MSVFILFVFAINTLSVYNLIILIKLEQCTIPVMAVAYLAPFVTKPSVAMEFTMQIIAAQNGGFFMLLGDIYHLRINWYPYDANFTK